MQLPCSPGNSVDGTLFGVERSFSFFSLWDPPTHPSHLPPQTNSCTFPASFIGRKAATMAEGGDLMHSSSSAQLQGHHPCCHSMRASSVAGRRTEPQSLPPGLGTGANKPHQKSVSVPVSPLTPVCSCAVMGTPCKTPLAEQHNRAPPGGTGKSLCIQSPAFRLVRPIQPKNKPLNWSPGNLHTLCIDTNKLRR